MCVCVCLLQLIASNRALSIEPRSSSHRLIQIWTCIKKENGGHRFIWWAIRSILPNPKCSPPYLHVSHGFMEYTCEIFKTQCWVLKQFGNMLWSKPILDIVKEFLWARALSLCLSMRVAIEACNIRSKAITYASVWPGQGEFFVFSLSTPAKKANTINRVCVCVYSWGGGQEKGE